MKDCLAYFHLSPVWEKVLKGFREKYISYGRFGGKVILKNLKPTDIEELEGFFGKSFHSQKSVTVSSEKFRQALETSRYKEITPECLLENFFEEPLLGRQEQKSLREQEKERIWEIFQRDYEGTPVETALESLRSIVKDNGSQELAKWDNMLFFRKTCHTFMISSIFFHSLHLIQHGIIGNIIQHDSCQQITFLTLIRRKYCRCLYCNSSYFQIHLYDLI